MTRPTERSPGTPPGTARAWRLLQGGAALVLAAFVIREFYGAAVHYHDFVIPYQGGHVHILEGELVFLMLYSAYGLAALLALAAGLHLLGVVPRLEDGIRALAHRPGLLIGGGAAFFAGTTLLLRYQVFLDVPVQYDEFSYRFIAQTLLEGRLINPLPGDEVFFSNVSEILFNQQGWYGKYPIGHPLLLAVGEVFGWTGVGLVPVVTGALTFALTVLVGARLFGPRVATLGGLLLLLSPQFVLTSATLVSQNSSTLFLVLGLWLTLRLEEQPTALRALLASAAWSYGVLVRPLPGALCALVAGLWILVRFYRDHLGADRQRSALLAVAAVPPLLTVAVFALQHLAQTGDPLSSGYHAQLGDGHISFFSSGDGLLGMSFLGALLRQGFWLHGWPLSFAFLPFLLLPAVRRDRAFQLVLALVGAVYFYRLLVPKTYVNTTGPSYVTEAVPLLVLLSARGIVAAREGLRAAGLDRLRRLVPAGVLAATLVALILFVPTQLKSIHRSAGFWSTPLRLLERVEAKKALVFSTILSPVSSGWTWTIRPPPPSPDLDDDVVFVRIDLEPGGVQRMFDFWQRRFPDRSPWFYVLSGDGSRRFEAAFGLRDVRFAFPPLSDD